MARKKANRGVKGEGYFSQVGDKYLYKIPAGTYENGRTKYKAFTGNTKKEAYERGMEYRRRVGDASAFGNDPYLKDYIMWWAKVYKRDAKSVRQSTYTRLSCCPGGCVKNSCTTVENGELHMEASW